MLIRRVFGLVTVQGAARVGVRRFGVPPGGFFDRESAAIANALVGRQPGEALLELSMARLEIECSEPFEFSLSGAWCELEIGGRKLSGGGLYAAAAGEDVVVSPPTSGARVYVAANFSSIGPGGRRLESGVELRCDRGRHTAGSLQLDSATVGDGKIRILRGPHADSFEFGALGDTMFSVSPNSDRVGIRCNEPPFPHDLELVSEPMGFGAVQVTRDGTPIVIGPDGPTIGGYPKIAYVIAADLDRLAQLRPGSSLSFFEVSLEEARRAAKAYQARVARRVAELALHTM